VTFFSDFLINHRVSLKLYTSSTYGNQVNILVWYYDDPFETKFEAIIDLQKKAKKNKFRGRVKDRKCRDN